MADFITTYNEIGPETVATGRRSDVPLVDGPASFLALAVKLEVPVLARKQIGGGGVHSVGGGFSFSVARRTGIKLRKDIDWINKIRRDWFDNVAVSDNTSEMLQIKGYITKRMVVVRRGRDQGDDSRDVETFAAITTEMRILAQEGIRRSRNIIAMIGISWTTRESSGRFLPEMLLESATEGSLAHYIRHYSHQLGAHDKALMLLDIVSGLGFLHEHGIAHCDMKPSNILVCDYPARQSLEALAIRPYIAKLCDFGCSVIVSDYPPDHRFILKVGTPGWMSPEMEEGSALDAKTLCKTDIYSLGKMAAAIATGTLIPVNIEPTEISTLLKGSTKKHIKANLTLFSAFMSRTLQWEPSHRADAAELFTLCKDHLVEDIHEFCPGMPLVKGISVIDRFMSTLPICPGQPLTKISESGITCTSSVPDFAFETDIRSSQLPRQCRKEVFQDLQQRATYNLDAGDSALQLAALLLNGYLDDDGKIKEKVKANLIQAIASDNEVAMSGAMNVLQAMGEELPEDSKLRILKRFQSSCFQEEALFQIKSLFFPLAFDASTRPEAYTGALCFPYAHRQHINEKLVGIRSWARAYRHDFADYLASPQYRVALYSVVLRIVKQHGTVSFFPRRWGLHSTINRYIQDPELTLGDLSLHEQSLFIGEALDGTTLDQPTTTGLTLLQLAVCRADLLAAETLLGRRLRADVNAYGATPKWTPVWLACFLGYYEMACLLIQHKADLACQDSAQGITILHLLSQFSSQDEIEDIGRQVLAAGVDIDDGFVPQRRDGNRATPLLASMLVFDFSDGKAVQFFLNKGGNTLSCINSYSEVCSMPVTPLSLCVLNLDPALLQAMISTTYPSLPESMIGPTIRSAQSIGLQLMRTKTCFRSMYETGKNYKNLKFILRMVTSWTESRILYWRPSWSPLAFAYDIDRADIMRLLLKIDPNASLDVCDAGATLNILDECIMRNNFRSVKGLIQHGADVLESNPLSAVSSMLDNGRTRTSDLQHVWRGETRLCRVAREMPLILRFVINHLESLPADRRRGQSVRSILGSWQFNSAGIFDTLVTEGTSDELPIAEFIRVKYRLDHDRMQPFPSNDVTLIAALIAWSNACGYGKLEQIRYLLSLDPKPRFRLPNGVNLLQIALIASEGADTVEQIELIRLLLNAYPDMASLTGGWRQHLPALFRAVCGTNLEIIRLLESHIRIVHPDKPLPYNYLHYTGQKKDGNNPEMTMLDACRLSIQDERRIERRKPFKLGLVDQLERHHAKKAIFKHLREKGAQLWNELDGYFIGARVVSVNAVSTRDLYAFMQRTTVKYGLGPWVHKAANPTSDTGTEKITWNDVQGSISGTGEVIGNNVPDSAKELSPFALLSSFQLLRVFELTWSENCLRLYACDLPVPTTDVAGTANSYFSKRVQQKEGWRSTYKGNPPYVSTDCCEAWIVSLRGYMDADYIEYTRPGRAWANDEVEKLSENVFGEWSDEFGEREESLPAELRAMVMSYF